jgi:arsenate reductase (thioredoxin)
METVLFACVHNAGRSQMAAAFFNKLCDPNKARAISAGTQPGKHVHPEVVQAMLEMGIDLSTATPQLLTAEVARQATLFVSMGCRDECPFVPGLRKIDWDLPDPKGQPIEVVRRVRDDTHKRVSELASERGWV